ncbi:MAG: RNA-binding S4 domain-containing protein [Bacillota bacterium]|nr:RNA-binding S4 domain-containing protein [Bacillota bacterium]
MRADKFLKVSRIIKRRSVAKEACETERIMINGKQAKPSSHVKEGDVLTVRFGNAEISVRVKEIAEHVPKDKAADLYEIISQHKIEQQSE